MEKDSMFDVLYKAALKNWKLLVLISMLAVIAGIIFSSPSFMAPRFESVAKVYPINIYPMSDESETEQMLELFEMDRIQESVIEEFELYKRWDLKPGEPEYRYFMDLLYQERVSISPTKNESVRLSCQDEDPEVAKAMVEHIIEEFNAGVRDLTRKQHADYLVLKQYELSRLEHMKDSLTRRMRALSPGQSIADLESESERYAESFARLLEKGASSAALDRVEERLSTLASVSGEMRFLYSSLENLGEEHSELLAEITAQYSKTNDQQSYTKIVSYPKVADKKVFPVRWIIVMLSAIGGFFIALVAVVFKERVLRF
jgi:LPS O-antigen subunit length determinant protein (WzzB/FepE family)